MLPAMDAALIDGDHNWYTVYNELKLLAATAREADAALPVLVLHDVGWPYGRRDLYYAPERIPDEYRQPYEQKGLRLPSGSKYPTGLVESGGFNPKLNNALDEGGPRNGVMTALEDFVAEDDGDLRVFVLPIYFSLAVVAEEERIAAQPELAAAFERFESPAFLREMLQLAEQLRLKELHWSQVFLFRWQEAVERSARRYLDLLKADLGAESPGLDQLEACLETIRAEKVGGDLVQCGTAGDGEPVLMRGFVEAYEMELPRVWVADAHPREQGGEAPPADEAEATRLSDLRRRLQGFDLLDERVNFVWGPLEATLPEAPIDKVALLRLGADVPPGAALELLYDKVTLGGYVVVDGHADAERWDQVRRFRADHGVEEALELIDSAGCGAWRKLGARPTPRRRTRARRRRR